MSSARSSTAQNAFQRAPGRLAIALEEAQPLGREAAQAKLLVDDPAAQGRALQHIEEAQGLAAPGRRGQRGVGRRRGLQRRDVALQGGALRPRGELQVRLLAQHAGQGGFGGAVEGQEAADHLATPRGIGDAREHVQSSFEAVVQVTGGRAQVIEDRRCHQAIAFPWPRPNVAP